MNKVVTVTVSFVLIISTSAIHFEGTGLLPGDVVIGGLFSVYFGENNQCQEISEFSVQNVEAVKWIFNKLNENNFIPGVKIGLLTLPTCRLNSRGNNRVFELITDIKNRQFGHYNDSTSPFPIIGIIGPEFSSTAQTTSRIISSLPTNDRLLQIGYSTTASVLDDKQQYPNLFTVIPSDDIQVQVMVALMKKLQWNQIALVFENDTYGIEGSNLLKVATRSEGICIAFEKAISVVDGVISFQTALALISDIQQRNIKGVLFFGYSRTANSILIASKSSPFSEHIQFIFSEGVGVKESIFKDSNNQILNNAKGSYIVSPPKLEIDEFSNHWKSIFTSMEKLKNESKTNPWLVDIFQSYTDCKPNFNLQSAGCNPMTANEIEAKYEESLSVSYAVRAALLVAKVISDVYLDICQNSKDGMCPGFKTMALNQKGTLISKLNSISVDFQKDFPFNLTEFETIGLQLRIEENEMTYLPLSVPIYEVYHYRKCLGILSDFCLVKIGNYSGNQLEIEEALIRDYSTDTDGISWPDISRAVCKPGTKCSVCETTDLPSEVYFQDGDFLVVGIVPVHDKHTSNPLKCGDIRTAFGMELVEAITYSVKRMNENTGQFANYFKDKTVGFLVINSCNQPLVIEKKLLNIIENGLVLRNGSTIQISDKIIGFIGGYGSEISMATADVNSKLGYVQISYGSTAAILSDRSTFPYFLRVATPDDQQSELLIKIVKMLDSNYIQVVYSSETYGIGGRDSLRIAANRSKVCIKNEIEVKEGVYNKVLDTLRVNPFAKLVVVFIRSHIVPDFMKYLSDQMNYGEFMFIGTESWGKNFDVINGNRKLEGSLSLSLEMQEDEGYNKYLRSLDPLTYTQNPWFHSYFETKYQCYFPSSFDKSQPKTGLCNSDLRLASSSSYRQELWTPFTINAGYALMLGANDALNEICGINSKTVCADFKRQPNKLLEKIKSVQLNISGRGLEQVFDENGDGSVGYVIYNTQIDPGNRQNLRYIQVGSSPLNGKDYALDKTILTYPVDISLPSVCPNDVKCKLCFPEEKSVSEPQSNGSAVAGLGAFVGILLVLIAVLIVALIYIIRKSKPHETETKNDNYLHAIQPHGYDMEADHYSQVSEDNIQGRPPPPDRRAEAQAAVAVEKSASRDTGSYIAPVSTKNTATSRQSSESYVDEFDKNGNNTQKALSF